MTLRFGSLLSLSLWMIHNSALVVPSLALSSTVPPPPVSSTTHFHLQFDGCFRPPRDPGFPTIDHRMAVCGACIGRVVDAFDRNGDNNELREPNHPPRAVIPLAVGAMELPVSTETTSQHAEYEGLLLGLEWLLAFLPSCRNAHHERVVLTIEGDCKTVIDQLKGTSVPRKLESLHQRAACLLDQLAAECGVHSNTTATAKDRFTADYCHIPRSQNLISDSLCNTLMAIVSAKSWVDRIHELEEAENRILEEMHSSPCQTHPEPPPWPLSDMLETAVRTTKYSLRLVLYERVANLAIQTEDFQLLIQIGEVLVQEDSSLAKNSPTAVKRMGVHYQIQGWEGLGKEKKTRFLKRKHRILLSKDDGCHGNSSGVNNDDEESITFAVQGQKLGGKPVPVSEPNKPRNSNIRNQKIRNMGDVTEGEWNALIPPVWKPLLDQWFVSARYPEHVDKVAAVGDKPLPVWVTANT